MRGWSLVALVSVAAPAEVRVGCRALALPEEDGTSEVPAAVCGDGVVDGDEECDAGPDNVYDPAEAVVGDCVECRTARCGDGVVQADEACDAGGIQDASCEADCRTPECGDAVVNAASGEECDPGTGAQNESCEADCRSPVCGDGVLNPWSAEECDDGNQDEGDRCGGDCLRSRITFVTSEHVMGSIGGTAVADQRCQEAAEAGGLPGNFMAWIADSTPLSAPLHRFGSEDFAGHYVTTDGRVVAVGWAGLTQTDGSEVLLAPISADEFGLPVGTSYAWTNVRADGSAWTSDSCSDWLEDISYGRIGKIDADDSVPTQKWTEWGLQHCSIMARLYCFQVSP